MYLDSIHFPVSSYLLSAFATPQKIKFEKKRKIHFIIKAVVPMLKREPMLDKFLGPSLTPLSLSSQPAGKLPAERTKKGILKI